MFTTNIKSGNIKVDGDFQPFTIPSMFHETVSKNMNNLYLSPKSTNDANLIQQSFKVLKNERVRV